MVSNSFPRYPGDAAGKFVLESAASLVSQGHAVHVLVPHQANSLVHEVMNGVLVHRFRYAPESLEAEYGRWYPHEWVNSTSKLLLYILRLVLLPAMILVGIVEATRYCSSNQVDWIIGHWTFPSGLVAYVAGRLTRSRTAIRAYGGDVVVLTRYPVLREIVVCLLRHVDLVLPISKETARDVINLGIPEDKVKVVYLGLDPGRYHPGLDGAFIRERHGIPDDAVLVMSLGRLVPYKGFQYLIDAARLVLQHRPDVRFLIAGAGPLRTALEQQVAELGLADCVSLVGFVEEPDQPFYYSACDIYVSSSIVDSAGNREGLGMTVFEAMACQKAVVVTDAGAPKELVQDGLTGFIVREKDARGLANKISHLVDNPEVRVQIANTAIRHVQRFEWSVLAEKTRVVLERHDATT